MKARIIRFSNVEEERRIIGKLVGREQGTEKGELYQNETTENGYR